MHKFVLRTEEELFKQLEKLAKENMRSVNSEINVILLEYLKKIQQKT